MQGGPTTLETTPLDPSPPVRVQRLERVRPVRSAPASRPESCWFAAAAAGMQQKYMVLEQTQRLLRKGASLRMGTVFANEWKLPRRAAPLARDKRASQSGLVGRSLRPHRSGCPCVAARRRKSKCEQQAASACFCAPDGRAQSHGGVFKCCPAPARPAVERGSVRAA